MTTAKFVLGPVTDFAFNQNGRFLEFFLSLIRILVRGPTFSQILQQNLSTNSTTKQWLHRPTQGRSNCRPWRPFVYPARRSGHFHRQSSLTSNQQVYLEAVSCRMAVGKKSDQVSPSLYLPILQTHVPTIAIGFRWGCISPYLAYAHSVPKALNLK